MYNMSWQHGPLDEFVSHTFGCKRSECLYFPWPIPPTSSLTKKQIHNGVNWHNLAELQIFISCVTEKPTSTDARLHDRTDHFGPTKVPQLAIITTLVKWWTMVLQWWFSTSLGIPNLLRKEQRIIQGTIMTRRIRASLKSNIGAQDCIPVSNVEKKRRNIDISHTVADDGLSEEYAFKLLNLESIFFPNRRSPTAPSPIDLKRKADRRPRHVSPIISLISNGFVFNGFIHL